MHKCSKCDFISEIMVPTHLAGAGTRDSKPGGSGSCSGAGPVPGQGMQA